MAVKFYFGKRVRSPGAPPIKHKRRRFLERPEDRCEKHYAYRAGCANCVPRGTAGVSP